MLGGTGTGDRLSSEVVTMRFPIELPEPQADKLRGEAQRLGVRPEDLATAAVVDLLNREDGDFEAAASYVLQKNSELYRRLA